MFQCLSDNVKIVRNMKPCPDFLLIVCKALALNCLYFLLQSRSAIDGQRCIEIYIQGNMSSTDARSDMNVLSYRKVEGKQ